MLPIRLFHNPNFRSSGQIILEKVCLLACQYNSLLEGIEHEKVKEASFKCENCDKFFFFFFFSEWHHWTTYCWRWGSLITVYDIKEMMIQLISQSSSLVNSRTHTLSFYRALGSFNSTQVLVLDITFLQFSLHESFGS